MLTEQPDFIEAGHGETVVLIHSSVAGAKQWRGLMKVLAEDYHVVAINLFGYGTTPGWNEGKPQTLRDQAQLVEAFLPADGSKVSIVGHSFGGSVAMKAAQLYKDRVRRLVLIEPNPFYLLREQGYLDAYDEAVNLRDTIKECGGADRWEVAAEKFANYWAGPGSWNEMPDDRKTKFAQALKPNFFEWDAVMHEDTPLIEWSQVLPRDTTVISSADTVRSIKKIVELMEGHFPEWTFDTVAQGGHMAIMSKPDEVNPIVARALR